MLGWWWFIPVCPRGKRSHFENWLLMQWPVMLLHFPLISSLGNKYYHTGGIESAHLRSVVKTLRIDFRLSIPNLPLVVCWDHLHNSKQIKGMTDPPINAPVWWPQSCLFEDLAPCSCWISDPPSCLTSKLAGRKPMGVFNRPLLAVYSLVYPGKNVAVEIIFDSTFESKTCVRKHCYLTGIKGESISAAPSYEHRWLVSVRYSLYVSVISKWTGVCIF